MQPTDLLQPTPAGLYSPAGDFYVDPVRAVPRAVITHGHADHARAGHGAVLATAPTVDVMRLRYDRKGRSSYQAAAYGETVEIGGVGVTLRPAGHVLGSAQVALEHRGLRIVVSGDYKRRPDPTCEPFEPVACDIFITEATFALPVFRHPDALDEVGKLMSSLRAFPERCHLVGAYSLGKAQRMLALLRQAGYNAPVYVHRAVADMNALYAAHGCDLGPTRTLDGMPAAELAGEIAISPPGGDTGVVGDWPDPVVAMASGWMGVRARARQRGVELPLTISDHADWDELTATTHEMGDREVWITHGRDDALGHHLAASGKAARALDLVGRDDDE